MNNSPDDVLKRLYAAALALDILPLGVEQTAYVQAVVDHAETQKAVLAALLTSLTKKLVTPQQDVRLHKVELPGGYSGRGFDTTYITPFIREHFPRLAMRSGSGWLTRSIEQLAPFTLDFPGRIQNAAVKTAFLHILDDVETHNADPRAYLLALLRLLDAKMQADQLSAQPITMIAHSVTIVKLLAALRSHFYRQYHTSGASRLPVIAIHVIYELLLDTPRYQGKQLVPLKGHTTSDLKSHTIGDVEIITEVGKYFEAVEVKHRIAITPTMVRDAFEKVNSTPLTRYYLLTTAEPNTIEQEQVSALTEQIHTQFGIEIIVNGIMPSLKYYLRLLPDLAAFVAVYTQRLADEYAHSTDIKLIHVQAWNEIYTELMNLDQHSKGHPPYAP